MNKSVIVIPCCKQKESFSTEAKNLYAGSFFKASRSLAERCDCDWFIFSIKYGLISPEKRIEPYSMVMKIHGFMRHQNPLPKEVNKITFLKFKKEANKILEKYENRVYLLDKEYFSDLIKGELPLTGMTTNYKIQFMINASSRDINLPPKLKKK